MFSNFDLSYEKDKNPLQGKLVIQTRFASGNAALAIADKPEIVKKIVKKRSDPYANSESTKRIGKWLIADHDTNLKLLRNWLSANSPNTSLLDFRTLKEYEQQRILAINDLNIP